LAIPAAHLKLPEAVTIHLDQSRLLDARELRPSSLTDRLSDKLATHSLPHAKICCAIAFLDGAKENAELTEKQRFVTLPATNELLDSI
jgi:hypothetical protein